MLTALAQDSRVTITAGRRLSIVRGSCRVRLRHRKGGCDVNSVWL